MPDQFPTDETLLTTADSGWRDTATVRLGVFHTTENDDSTDPADVARWQQNRDNQSSYHVLVGTDGRTVRSNDDDYSPWAAGFTGNRFGFHISAVGRAARTRADWESHPRQLAALARWAADLHTRYGLPLVWLTPAQVRAGARGFCGHREVSEAWHEVDHTDPGPGFPHALVLDRARAITSPTPEPPAPAPAPPLDALIFDQLTGPGPGYDGWPQLGNRTVVDALAAIGEALDLDGFKAPTKEKP